MLRIEIDRQEREDIRVKLENRQEFPDGYITGRHEDHGLVKLTREDGRFWCEAEEVGFVRGDWRQNANLTEPGMLVVFPLCAFLIASVWRDAFVGRNPMAFVVIAISIFGPIILTVKFLMAMP